MNKRLLVFILIYLLSVAISALSQILLKKSAKKQHNGFLREYLNPLVINAYALFLCSTLITMFALKVVPLSMAGIIESFGYIIVFVLSVLALKERITRKKLIGACLIVLGAIISSMQLGWYV